MPPLFMIERSTGLPQISAPRMRHKVAEQVEHAGRCALKLVGALAYPIGAQRVDFHTIGLVECSKSVCRCAVQTVVDLDQPRGDTVLVARLMSSSPTADPREPVWTTVTVSPSRLAMRHCGDAGSEGSMAVWEWPPMMMSNILAAFGDVGVRHSCVTSYPGWLTAITIRHPPCAVVRRPRWLSRERRDTSLLCSFPQL